MKWLISANGKMYDHVAAFDEFGFIDWRQKANYTVGDTVYIYATKPNMKVMFKTIVEKVNIRVLGAKTIQKIHYNFIKTSKTRSLHWRTRFCNL